MIKEAFEWIQNQVILGSQENQIQGRSYTPDWKPIYPPQRGMIGKFSSLEALVSYLSSVESPPSDEIQIVVDKDRSVSIVTAPDCIWQRRDVLACAVFDRKIFDFGTFMGIEEFIISAQCNFVDTENRRKMIEYLSSVTGEVVNTVGDDGISQSVIIKQATTGRVQVGKFDPMAELQPIRTFSDIDQPPSLFLFRLKQQEKGKPLVGLFEADGGAWRDEACRRISAWLKSHTLVTVIG